MLTQLLAQAKLGAYLAVALDVGLFKVVLKAAAAAGKAIVMTTQVPHEGSDMEVYQVGHRAKRELGLIEAYSMTSEAVVTKLMWILGQTDDYAEICRMFRMPVQKDQIY